VFVGCGAEGSVGEVGGADNLILSIALSLLSVPNIAFLFLSILSH
jgi:hypothetical protein